MPVRCKGQHICLPSRSTGFESRYRFVFPLPDFIDRLDHHEQQMLLVHAAMCEDAWRVCIENMGERFRQPEKRNANYFREGLAWAVQAMMSEASEMLQLAVISRHIHVRGPGEFPGPAYAFGISDGMELGRMESAYKVIRHGYQALRSHRMKPAVRSKHWDRVEPRFLELYDNTGDPRDPFYRD